MTRCWVHAEGHIAHHREHRVPLPRELLEDLVHQLGVAVGHAELIAGK